VSFSTAIVEYTNWKHTISSIVAYYALANE